MHAIILFGCRSIYTHSPKNCMTDNTLANISFAVGYIAYSLHVLSQVKLVMHGPSYIALLIPGHNWSLCGIKWVSPLFLIVFSEPNPCKSQYFCHANRCLPLINAHVHKVGWVIICMHRLVPSRKYISLASLWKQHTLTLPMSPLKTCCKPYTSRPTGWFVFSCHFTKAKILKYAWLNGTRQCSTRG